MPPPTTIPGRRLDELDEVVPLVTDFIVGYRPGETGIRFTIGSLYAFLVAALVDASGGTIIARIGAANLRARVTHDAHEFIYLSYWSTENDGNGGVYIFDATSIADDVGLPDVVKPDDIDAADPGRWIKTTNTT